MRAARFLGVACVLLNPAAAQPLFGQPLLDRVLIIAPAAPGGGWDQTARAMQQVLEAEKLVRVVEVQNVAGAAGTIGLAQFIDTHRGNERALLISGLVMLGATLWNDSPVSLEQVTPIARLTGEYEVIAVPASSPHRDIQGLVEAFRRHPGTVSWGGGSAGGTDHILAALVASAAGVDPRRVNYIAFSGGGEAVAALLGGNVTAGISGYSEFSAHIESGRLRALGISSTSRVPGIEAPTLGEHGIAVELVNWRAVMAPSGISPDEKARLTALVAAMARSPRWRETLTDRAWTDMYLDGEGFERDLANEKARLVRIVSRLRGAGDAQSAGAGPRIFPIAIFVGAVIVAAGIVKRHRRGRSLDSGMPARLPANRRALGLISIGLVLFVLLIEPLGFIVAATVLFASVASAFGRAVLAPAIIGGLFCTLVYLAFTRGLDLALPSGLVWTWMR